jgi:hypothetical protein
MRERGINIMGKREEKRREEKRSLGRPGLTYMISKRKFGDGIVCIVLAEDIE